MKRDGRHADAILRTLRLHFQNQQKKQMTENFRHVP